VTRTPSRRAGARADRSPRADARRNRASVLEAAEAVFAAKGTSASTGEIARAAGVGIGTVFRHFPTKEDLLAAIMVTRMERLTEEARALAGAEDAGAAFFSFFQRMVEHSATKKAFAEALTVAGIDVKSVIAPVLKDLKRAIAALLTRAQEAGQIRPDVGVDEAMAIFKGASHAAEHTPRDRALHARTLAIIFDGLRPR
jgi:AcrR family transcriptional regulator